MNIYQFEMILVEFSHHYVIVSFAEWFVPEFGAGIGIYQSLTVMKFSADKIFS